MPEQVPVPKLEVPVPVGPELVVPVPKPVPELEVPELVAPQCQ